MAGAVFGEVGGCLVLLRALKIAFHASRGLIMVFFFVPGAAFGNVCGSLVLLRAL